MRIILSAIILILLTPLDAEVLVGDIPPSYLGKDKDGERVELSEMKGKVVVSTFWCPPCLKEMQVLEGIQRQLGKDKLEVVAINFKEGRKTYRAIVRNLEDFQITLTYDHKGKVANRYKVNTIPRMYIIDKSGRVSYVHKG